MKSRTEVTSPKTSALERAVERFPDAAPEVHERIATMIRSGEIDDLDSVKAVPSGFARALDYACVPTDSHSSLASIVAHRITEPHLHAHATAVMAHVVVSTSLTYDGDLPLLEPDWTSRVAVPWDVLDKLCGGGKSKPRSKSKSKKKASSSARYTTVVNALVEAGLLESSEYRDGRCRRWRMRYDHYASVIRAGVEQLVREGDLTTWCNLRNGRRTELGTVNRSMWMLTETEKRMARRRRSTGESSGATTRAGRPLAIDVSYAARGIADLIAASAAAQRYSDLVEATRAGATLLRIVGSDAYMAIGDGLGQFSPEYVQRASGRRYEVGGGFQTAPRALKQALALSPRTRELNTNLDIAACHVAAYAHLCACLNQNLTWRHRSSLVEPSYIPTDDLEYVVAHGYTNMAALYDLPEDLLKLVVLAVINGAPLSSHYDAAVGKLIRQCCPGETPHAVAERLRASLYQIRLTIAHERLVSRDLLRQFSLRGHRTRLRRVLDVRRDERGHTIIENAMGRLYDVTEQGRAGLMSHVLTGIEQHDVRATEDVLLEYGISTLSYEHDGLLLSSPIPRGALGKIRKCSILKHRLTWREKPLDQSPSYSERAALIIYQHTHAAPTQKVRALPTMTDECNGAIHSVSFSAGGTSTLSTHQEVSNELA
ncbi:MAG: hypothetical protein RLY93_09655 [Sumerlaeia bacterium]